ncbi:MAG: ATP-binding cassette domain-containing protein [Thermoflavifilum sp.]|nr:ATP-binding cassette domain-containing protein [Thermoflavifilum sp.]
MTILVDHIGKRYNYDWVFRHLSYRFEPHKPTAIIGPNGSGKSTLLQIIAGSMLPTEGQLHYLPANGQSLPADQIFRHISFTAPYLELIEDFSATESLKLLGQFRPLLQDLSISEMAYWVGLPLSAFQMPIRHLSSGMKQRVKLAHAFFLQSPVLLLDEPCTNLDREGVDMYHRLIQHFATHRTVIIASNHQEEYEFCTQILSVQDFKP